MSDQELIDALRCTAHPGGPVGDCKKCPFLRTEHIGTDLAKMAGKDEWESCDVDGVAIAAADRLANQNTHILALQKEIEGLRAKLPRWIPVTERLPGNGVKVLCWYEYFRYGEYNRMYQTFGIGYQFGGSWGGEVAQGQKAKVLAWMPLPEPPEVEE